MLRGSLLSLLLQAARSAAKHGSSNGDDDDLCRRAIYLCQGLQRSPRQTSLVLTVWRQVAAFSGMSAERLYLQVMWLA